ncbi:hypothetical protein EON65_15065 [archaeon]|nr:MAG: hypothetical protein EON65_15065 [archaeon]
MAYPNLYCLVFVDVFEEKVMSVDNVPPLVRPPRYPHPHLIPLITTSISSYIQVLIGCEGLWGTFLTIFIVYPIAYMLPGADGGRFENPWDAIAMIQNNSLLATFVMFFVLTVTIYNCAAVYVTKYLSAIWHAILDNFRPITIWGVGLFIHSTGSQYGEAWTDSSYLQLIALIVSHLCFSTTFVLVNNHY